MTESKIFRVFQEEWKALAQDFQLGPQFLALLNGAKLLLCASVKSTNADLVVSLSQ